MLIVRPPPVIMIQMSDTQQNPMNQKFRNLNNQRCHFTQTGGELLNQQRTKLGRHEGHSGIKSASACGWSSLRGHVQYIP